MVLEQGCLGPCYTTDFPLTETVGSQKYFCAWRGSLNVSSPASSSEQDQLQNRWGFTAGRKGWLLWQKKTQGYQKQCLVISNWKPIFWVGLANSFSNIKRFKFLKLSKLHIMIVLNKQILNKPMWRDLNNCSKSIASFVVFTSMA